MHATPLPWRKKTRAKQFVLSIEVIQESIGEATLLPWSSDKVFVIEVIPVSGPDSCLHTYRYYLGFGIIYQQIWLKESYQ